MHACTAKEIQQVPTLGMICKGLWVLLRALGKWVVTQASLEFKSPVMGPSWL